MQTYCNSMQAMCHKKLIICENINFVEKYTFTLLIQHDIGYSIIFLKKNANRRCEKSLQLRIEFIAPLI